MSEINAEQSTPIEPPVRSEATKTEILKTVFTDMQTYGVLPVAVIQGGREFNDFAPRTTEEIRERPFAVMQVMDANDEKQIYKRRMEDDPRDSANNESFFLQNIAPEIMAQLPNHLKDVVRFPVLKGRHADQRSFVEEYFQGQVMGGVHKASAELITPSDLHAIADTIKTIQSAGRKWIGDPGLHLKGSDERKAYVKYSPDFQKREAVLRSTVGDSDYEQLATLLKDREALLSSEEVFFAGSDIQTSNIIKMENGRLGMIDWERVNVTNNPALDYCFMYAVLWENPQLQDEYLQYAVSQNQDQPSFKEYFRLDFIFNRGSGELGHWVKQAQAAKTPDEKKECEAAVQRYKSLIKDALGKKGVWGDNQAPVGEQIAGK